MDIERREKDKEGNITKTNTKESKIDRRSLHQCLEQIYSSFNLLSCNEEPKILVRSHFITL